MTRAAIVLALLVALGATLGGTATRAATHAATCPKVKRPAPRSETRNKPKTHLNAKKTWTATVTTSCGTFKIRLAVKTSPNTTASFASLARTHFFDRTIFHRVVPGFVIQGGDPTQTESGGPGYSVADKPPATTKYRLGTVAMAKTQTDPPGTSGSQFFVVTGDASFLTPDYAVLGRVVSGLPVALTISRYGDVNDPAGRPTRIVVVRSITISSR